MSTWYTGGEHDVARSQLSSAAQLEGELYCLRHLVGMVKFGCWGGEAPPAVDGKNHSQRSEYSPLRRNIPLSVEIVTVDR